MRTMLCALLLLLLLPMACAEEESCVAEGLPELHITWRNTGAATSNERRPWLLAADITAEDGSFTQTVTWESAEASDQLAAHVRLVDYNFDGYKDLQLLAAQGARNVFYAVALWDVEKGCFREVAQDCPRLPGVKSADKVGQAEFCNPEFYPDANNPGFGWVYCVEEDGFFYRTERVYKWELGYGLEIYWVASVYGAGEGLIGESLEQWGTGFNYWWNQTYPEDWYYGEGNGSAKRTEARRLLMLGRGTVESCYMQVSNVSWVNLRQMDSKESPSLARLDRGTTVQVLATGCGEDGGWVLVTCGTDALGVKTGMDKYHDDQPDGATGYIWHSYLEPTLMYVANVDWVNVREAPDKQSAVVTTAVEGTRLRRRPADEKDGWIPVAGVGEDFTGWVWHSYLEAKPFIPWKDAP